MNSLNFSDQKISLKVLGELFQKDFEEGSSHLTKYLLEWIMEGQRDEYMHLEAFDETEQRIDYRNGYYLRDIRTKTGLVEDLRVPRTRTGGFFPEVLPKYSRVHDVVDQGIRQMYLRGVSTTNVGSVLKALVGFEVSSGYVCQATRRLDQMVRVFHQRRIPDDIVYLYLDGIYLKDRELLKSRRRPVLVAYAVRSNGQREFIHFRIAKSESESEWLKFLNELYQKGLKGDLLQLIVTDGCAGLLAALDAVYPYVSKQRCWVHKMRNLSNKVKKTDLEECLNGARKIYVATNRKKALQAFKRWALRWKQYYPKVVLWLEEDLEHLLAFFDFPSQYHVMLRTTNVIERGFGEVRRRTKVMGCLPNTKSVNRIVYARLDMLNHKWSHPYHFVKGMIEMTQLVAA